MENRVDKKLILLILGRIPSQSQVFLPAANFESDRITSNKHGLAANTDPKWLPPKSIFKDEFHQDIGHFRGRNLGESR